YLEAEDRLLEPQIYADRQLTHTDWPTAIAQAALQLRQFSGPEIAVIASGRMTNEELWLAAQVARSLGTQWIDIVPRREPGDKILLSEDRNPNTNGARLILGSQCEPGANLLEIADAVKSGKIKALVVLKENEMNLGISFNKLGKVTCF